MLSTRPPAPGPGVSWGDIGPPAPHLAARYLHSLDLELHVVFSGGLAVFPLLPAVTILAVFDLLPVVEDHGSILGAVSDTGLSYQEGPTEGKFMNAAAGPRLYRESNIPHLCRHHFSPFMAVLWILRVLQAG